MMNPLIQFRRMRRMDWRVFFCLLAACVFPIVAIDLIAMLPPRWDLIMLVTVSLATMAFACIAGARNRPFYIIGLAAAVALQVLIIWLPWNSRKVFWKDFTQIEPGMTVAEVQRQMVSYIGGGQPAAAPIPGEQWLGYRHALTGNYNSDIGVIYFRDGIVIRTEFLPD